MEGGGWLRQAIEKELVASFRIPKSGRMIVFLEKAVLQSEMAPVTVRVTSARPSPSGQRVLVTAIFNGVRRSGIFEDGLDEEGLRKEATAWVNQELAGQAMSLSDRRMTELASAELAKALDSREIGEVKEVLASVYARVTERDGACAQEVSRAAGAVLRELSSVPREEIESRRRCHERNKWTKKVRRAIEEAVEAGVPEASLRRILGGAGR